MMLPRSTTLYPPSDRSAILCPLLTPSWAQPPPSDLPHCRPPKRAPTFTTLTANPALVAISDDVRVLMEDPTNVPVRRRYSRRGQNIYLSVSGLRQGHTHLDIRTHGSALRPHFNVCATGSEVNDDEVWLYLCDRDCLTSRVYATSQGQGTTLQLPFYCNLSHGAYHFRCRCPALPRWNGRNLSYHLNTTWRGQKYPRIPRMQASLLVATLQPTTTRTT